MAVDLSLPILIVADDKSLRDGPQLPGLAQSRDDMDKRPASFDLAAMGQRVRVQG
jgi:hypothetical protein